MPNLTYDDRDRPLGTYRYSVKALGSDGTVSTAVRVDATVSDIVPPGTPTSFTGKSASATTVKLSWNTATDNIGVVGYEIYRDGLPLPQPPVIVGTTISHTDTGLTTGKKYLYKIRAIDATGLKSAWSAEIPVTPVENKTTISLTQFPLVAKVGESVQLTASASDADGNLTSLDICEV
ncbi:MAG: igtZ, partial [Halothiobacillaceae bacterium]